MESAMNVPPQAAAGSSSASASVTRRNAALSGLTEVTGRVLLALLFLLSGVGKLGAYGSTAAYMSSAGVAGALLPAVVATELGGALALLLGWKTPGIPAPLARFSGPSASSAPIVLKSRTGRPSPPIAIGSR